MDVFLKETKFKNSDEFAGLAEAGMIFSRLIGDDTERPDDGNSVFSPNRYSPSFSGYFC